MQGMTNGIGEKTYQSILKIQNQKYPAASLAQPRGPYFKMPLFHDSLADKHRPEAQSEMMFEQMLTSYTGTQSDTYRNTQQQTNHNTDYTYTQNSTTYTQNSTSNPSKLIRSYGGVSYGTRKNYRN